MAELLETILDLPEQDRWDLAQAILDSLRPASSLELAQAAKAENTYIDWKNSGGEGVTLAEISASIEKKKAEKDRNKS